jgi:predicted nuclease of restriction endonuclease-like RecB superfamily
MLPSDLLIHRTQGGQLVPKRLPLDDRTLALAGAPIAIAQAHQGRTQGELDRALAELEGDSPDFKITRGLAHLVKNHCCTFEVVSPLEPIDLRRQVFGRAAQVVPSPENAAHLLAQMAQELSATGDRDVFPAELRTGLYADLPENRILTTYDPPTPTDLLHRYNLSQVQGIFYRASHLVIHAYRNDPGEYKNLFRYLKLFRLMTYIEGDEDCGFTITVDGPTSLFKANTRYGLDLAKALPALLHVTRWRLDATLQLKDTYSKTTREAHFQLDADCGLVSHYAPGKVYDSTVEESFVQRWNKGKFTEKTGWSLEREVNLIPIPGSVMIPDFRLVHPDGRTRILEIVGYWRPEYLRKKLAQVRQAERSDLVLAVSERLNLEKAGVDLSRVPVPVVWFKDKLQPQAVLAAIAPE